MQCGLDKDRKAVNNSQHSPATPKIRNNIISQKSLKKGTKKEEETVKKSSSSTQLLIIGMESLNNYKKYNWNNFNHQTYAAHQSSFDSNSVIICELHAPNRMVSTYFTLKNIIRQHFCQFGRIWKIDISFNDRMMGSEHTQMMNGFIQYEIGNGNNSTIAVMNSLAFEIDGRKVGICDSTTNICNASKVNKIRPKSEKKNENEKIRNVLDLVPKFEKFNYFTNEKKQVLCYFVFETYVILYAMFYT